METQLSWFPELVRVLPSPLVLPRGLSYLIPWRSRCFCPQVSSDWDNRSNGTIAFSSIINVQVHMAHFIFYRAGQRIHFTDKDTKARIIFLEYLLYFLPPWVQGYMSQTLYLQEHQSRREMWGALPLPGSKAASGAFPCGLAWPSVCAVVCLHCFPASQRLAASLLGASCVCLHFPHLSNVRSWFPCH